MKEKGNKTWWIVLVIATVVIGIVATFFIVKNINGNPLEGKWKSKEQGYFLEIEKDDEATLKTTIQSEEVTVKVYYTLDKDAKTITFKPNFKSCEEAAKATNDALTASEIDAYITDLMMAFDYSLEKDTLTLTEREYADKFTFKRVK